MPFYQVKSTRGGQILYSGHFINFRACLEHAVTEGVSLKNADLRRTNLLNATLDGADLRGADFTAANLAGVNLSEAKLDNAVFAAANLTGAVLCESSLTGAHFIGTQFGATLIDDCVLDRAHFSALSTFTLDFSTARSMRDCLFIGSDQTVCPMTRPPVVVRGLPRLLVLMDCHVKIGTHIQPLDRTPPESAAALAPVHLRLRLEQLVAGQIAKAA